LKFNKYYFDFFINRYSSLRTEFDDYEYRISTSTEQDPVSYLKPYFELLGLDETATDEEIKRAYHNLALQHHPDLPKNSARIEECETLMTKINEAYEKVRR
jgi:DnaJ-class molecular chaperone